MLKFKCAPADKMVAEINHLTLEDANRIRAIWHCNNFTAVATLLKTKGYEDLDKWVSDNFPHRLYRPRVAEYKLEIINHITDSHGVEYLGEHKRSGYDVYYINSGDTYVSTLINIGNHLRLTCIGDLIELDKILVPESY